MVIVFGIGGHINGIGGVENSVRSMVKVLKPSDRAIIVCPHDKLIQQAGFSLNCPAQCEVIECDYSIFAKKSLFDAYKNIAQRFPNAFAICRNHLHVLAAGKAGIPNVYLVPSLITHQVRQEISKDFSARIIRQLAFSIIHSAYQKKAFIATKAIYVFSESMQRQVQTCLASASPKVNIRIVKPGIDSQRFQPTSSEKKELLRGSLGLPVKKKLLLFVGRIVRAKGLDLAVMALSELNSTFHLVVVGDGDFRPEVEKLSQTLGLVDRISFFGPKNLVEDFYRAADVFLMTSSYEPLGQTILEALSSGLPVVAFSKRAGVETASEELGMSQFMTFAEEHTAKALAHAVLTATQNLGEHRARTISDQAAKHFSWRLLLRELMRESSGGHSQPDGETS